MRLSNFWRLRSHRDSLPPLPSTPMMLGTNVNLSLRHVGTNREVISFRCDFMADACQRALDAWIFLCPSPGRPYCPGHHGKTYTLQQFHAKPCPQAPRTASHPEAPTQLRDLWKQYVARERHSGKAAAKSRLFLRIRATPHRAFAECGTGNQSGEAGRPSKLHDLGASTSESRCPPCLGFVFLQEA